MQTVSGGDLVTNLIGENALATLTERIDNVSSLLFRINEQNDLLIALLVTVIIVAVCYSILHAFTRF